MSDLAQHHAGKSSNRSTTNLTLSVGLLTVPLAIYKGVDDDTRVKRSMFTTEGHSVGNMQYDKTTGTQYAGDVVKRVELAPDLWVDLSDDEIESVLGEGTKGQAEIDTFIPLAAIGREYVITDTCHARVPKLTAGTKKAANTAGERSYVLLCRAMADAGVAALAKVTLRSVARYAAFTPDGRVLFLAYNDQVRTVAPMPDVEVSERELELAAALVRDVVGIDTPVLTDTDTAKVLGYVEAKAAGGDVAEAAVEIEEVAPVQDLTALLEAAVTAARSAKGAATEAA